MPVIFSAISPPESWLLDPNPGPAKSTLPRTAAVAIVAGALILVGATVIMFWPRAPSNEGIPPTAESAAPLTPEATAVARVIADLPADPELNVASSVLAQGIDLTSVLPAGTTIEVDATSWAPENGMTGVMAATIKRPGETPKDYGVFMVLEADVWKVAGTVEIVEDTE